MTQASPHITLSTLPRADGSATYKKNGYHVICGVNGPIEVQRRDPLPEEAILEVNVRPATGGGSIRDRHHETLLHTALHPLLLASAHPRSLIQLTLQIISSPSNAHHINGPPASASQIDILPALLNAAIMALLSASIPLTATLVATLVVVDWEGGVHVDPADDGKVVGKEKSTHIFGFESGGGCVVMESEGEFGLEEWEGVYERARGWCLGGGGEDGEGRDPESDEDGDIRMEGQQSAGGGLLGGLRRTMEKKAEAETRWKRDAD